MSHVKYIYKHKQNFVHIHFYYYYYYYYFQILYFFYELGMSHEPMAFLRNLNLRPSKGCMNKSAINVRCFHVLMTQSLIQPSL
jgi:hypothetical protein